MDVRPIGCAVVPTPRMTTMKLDPNLIARIDRARIVAKLRHRSQYIRQAIELRLLLDEEGWTESTLREAEKTITRGGWKD